jgi:hypothetical protein
MRRTTVQAISWCGPRCIRPINRVDAQVIVFIDDCDTKMCPPIRLTKLQRSTVELCSPRWQSISGPLYVRRARRRPEAFDSLVLKGTLFDLNEDPLNRDVKSKPRVRYRGSISQYELLKIFEFAAVLYLDSLLGPANQHPLMIVIPMGQPERLPRSGIVFEIQSRHRHRICEGQEAGHYKQRMCMGRY